MVKIWADGADLGQMLKVYPKVSGYTTNPSLMRQAGIKNYTAFAKSALVAIPDKPISFEVFSDDFTEMERQARLLASWGGNVYVKIPITNTKGESSIPLIAKLVKAKIKVNVTAVFTHLQISSVAQVKPAIISIFAGRIADTGINPVEVFNFAMGHAHKETQILWASTRELFNIKQAETCADIITVPASLLDKMHLFGKSLEEFSLETVCMFHEDAKASQFTL